VLWLTSSTSPGQVQELDELARELRRGKPLLPVLTRSDVIDEDEVDGQIVKCLRNKSDANRADQEADVRARAADKLQALGVALHQLKAPVSISAYVARTAGADAEAMRGAGFERLYAALSTCWHRPWPIVIASRPKCCCIICRRMYWRPCWDRPCRRCRACSRS
jgi:hypothetical protein